MCADGLCQRQRGLPIKRRPARGAIGAAVHTRTATRKRRAFTRRCVLTVHASGSAAYPSNAVRLSGVIGAAVHVRPATRKRHAKSYKSPSHINVSAPRRPAAINKTRPAIPCRPHAICILTGSSGIWPHVTRRAPARATRRRRMRRMACACRRAATARPNLSWGRRAGTSA